MEKRKSSRYVNDKKLGTVTKNGGEIKKTVTECKTVTKNAGEIKKTVTECRTVTKNGGEIKKTV
ncbi:hypothetical protein, partial [Cytobacillus horneckiae]|uniref:hypothetical protein n=1 Tax=Cytobacillus horneckiae TaxID=549687 RepID=UPI003D22C907